jgi:hypothetical protein
MALAVAEATLDGAQKRRAEAREVRAALEAEIQTQQQRIGWAERTVADAVVAALAGDPAVAKLITAYARAAGVVDDLANALRSLPLSAVPKHHPALVQSWYKDNSGAIPPDVPQAPRWRNAIEALKRGELVDLPAAGP